eukprot:9741408-Alexandrium_andersonii.AAC.1
MWSHTQPQQAPIQKIQLGRQPAGLAPTCAGAGASELPHAQICHICTGGCVIVILKGGGRQPAGTRARERAQRNCCREVG